MRTMASPEWPGRMDGHCNRNACVYPNCGSDIECMKKDKTIELLKNEIQCYSDERNKYLYDNHWLRSDVNKLKETVDQKNEEIKGLQMEMESIRTVSQKKMKGVNESVNQMEVQQRELDALAQELKVDNTRLGRDLDAKDKQLSEKLSLLSIQQRLVRTNGEKLKAANEKIQSLESDVQFLNKSDQGLRTEINKLNENICLLNKNIDDLTQSGDKLSKKTKKQSETIKELIQANNKLQDSIAANKDIDEKYRRSIQEYKKLKAENSSLKQQRSYFQTHNESHKRKYVSSEVSAKKSRSLYANGLKDISKIGLDGNEDFVKEVIDFIERKRVEYQRNLTAQTADIFVDIRDKSQLIAKGAEKTLKKRADGRVSCSELECEQTFATTGDLRHHMTVTHNMRIDDKTSGIEIIDLDD